MKQLFSELSVAGSASALAKNRTDELIVHTREKILRNEWVGTKEELLMITFCNSDLIRLFGLSVETVGAVRAVMREIDEKRIQISALGQKSRDFASQMFEDAKQDANERAPF
jgi:hypothetical protein